MKQTDGNKKFWQQISDFLETAVRAGRDCHDIVGKIYVAAIPEERHLLPSNDSDMLPLDVEHAGRWEKMLQFFRDSRVKEDWGSDMVLSDLRLIAMGVRDLDQIGPLPLLPLYD